MQNKSLKRERGAHDNVMSYLIEYDTCSRRPTECVGAGAGQKARKPILSNVARFVTISMHVRPR